MGYIQKLCPILLVGTHIVPQIDLQQAIHPLRLAIHLRVKASGEVQVRPHELEELRSEPTCEAAISITHDRLRQTQYFTTCFRNSGAATSTGHLAGAGMKMPYFENRSTTTIIMLHPSDLGKPMMKSMEMLSQGRSGIDSGSSNPVGTLCSVLSCWHTRQVFT